MTSTSEDIIADCEILRLFSSMSTESRLAGANEIGKYFIRSESRNAVPVSIRCARRDRGSEP